jgi:branched-chain amino acid aminotransferase
MPDLAASHVWFDGRLVPAQGPHISVYDRGFQIGDGVFEALRAKRGVAIELDGHLARLRRSLAGLDFDIPFGDDVLGAGIEELLAAEGWAGIEPAGDAAVRITVSRGFDPARGVAPKAGLRASVAIQAWPYSPPAEHVLAKGERLVVSRIRRVPDSPMGAIKSISRAELVYARIEARRAGADDALFLTTDGMVAEATTSNVVAIFDDQCATPPIGGALLAGTTRAWLLAHGGSVGLTMVERDIALDELLAAQEAAVCSSIAGVVPVTAVDGRPIGEGRPGARTLALRAARESWIDQVSIEGAQARQGGGPAGGADARTAS